MRRSLLHILLALATVIPAVAQGRPPQTLDDFYAYGDNYFLEITTFPGTSPTKGRAIVSFRLSYDLLNFRKEGSPSGNDAVYISTPSLFVEAAGSDGVIAARDIWRDTVRTTDYSATNSKSVFVSGTIELALRPDNYTVKYTFADGGPESGFSETAPPLYMDDFASPSPAIGAPLFLRAAGDSIVTAAAVDGNALFGLPLRAYVPLASPSEPSSLTYRIMTAPKPGGAPRVVESGSARLLGHTTLGSAISSGNDLLFPIRRDSAVPGRCYGAMLEAPIDTLDVGDYLLVLAYQSGASSVTDTVAFKLRWIDMPISLLRADYAIKALYPIATEETIDRLLSGSSERKFAALKTFWQSQDPTPTTKYNEKMAEYYRRVDYAYFTFKSIEQRDGAFTDRGKIYILFGPPTNTERTMGPDAPPREIWEYHNRVNRTFIFADQSASGAYRLIEYHDL
jgi:GWxTD domain-containing protein